MTRLDFFNHFVIIVVALLCGTPAFGQTEKLSSDRISRDFNLGGNHFMTSSYRLTDSDQQYVRKKNTEFAFMLNDTYYSGHSNWAVRSRDTVCANGGCGKIFVLESMSKEGLILNISYIAYPDLPLIRKQITVCNEGSEDFCIENLDSEVLNVNGFGEEYVVKRYYGRYSCYGPYVGDWDDPVLALENRRERCGILIGTEAPGVTKRLSAMTDGSSITSGLRYKDQTYPFRKWIAPGCSWTAPAVFTALYANNKECSEVMETTIADYTRKYMSARYNSLDHKPVFLYNTWTPFLTNINQELVMKLADIAASCGIEEITMDDGWQVCNGDWRVDTQKFPGGMGPVVDYIRSLGMKPGFWIALATAKPFAPVVKEHPEWFTRSDSGDISNVHNGNPNWGLTACLGTGWKDYISDAIKSFVTEYDPGYLKLDLAIVSSAYMYDQNNSGCRAHGHPGHRDWNESFLALYDAGLEVVDRIHEISNDLFIDITFETAGKWQLCDYGLIKHADGNWLSNLKDMEQSGPLHVRHLAWSRSLAIPATSLSVGNMRLDGPDAELAFKSLAGTLPIFLGDLTKLTAEQCANFKAWSGWLRGVQDRHDFMSFRQDLPGFGEPAEGCWDGYMRINTETRSGGLVGVFRQGANESERVVTVKYLDPAKKYQVHEGRTGKVICTKTGKDLMEKGFRVKLGNKYDGQLYEIVLR